MSNSVPTHSDAPALFLLAGLYLAFGLFGILKPDVLRSVMDRFADYWREGAWHPYKMPPPVLRLVVGAIGILGSALFVYIAYVALGR